MPVPVVSVITATRNRVPLLTRALMSIRAQEFTDFEAVVVDDGSNSVTLDRYADLWKQLDERFKLVLPPAPGGFGTGPADARNRGIEKATGEYIAFLDDDDEWIAADHLKVGISALRQHGGDFFFANMRGHRNEKVTRESWLDCGTLLNSKQSLSGPPWIYELSGRDVAGILRHQVIHPDMLIVRRDLVQRFGGFLKHTWMFEDKNFVLHIADLTTKTLFRTDPVVSYRFPTQDSVSLTVSESFSFLQELTCCQEIRLSCRRACVRKSARSIEAWLYRKTSEKRLEGLEAIRFAWQALSLAPTLGAIISLASATVNALCRSLLRSRKHSPSAWPKDTSSPTIAPSPLLENPEKIAVSR